MGGGWGVTGEVEAIPLFLTLPVLALLSNCHRENCLINVGREGQAQTKECPGERPGTSELFIWKRIHCCCVSCGESLST